MALNAGDQFTFSLDQAVYHQGPVSLLAKTSEALTIETRTVEANKMIVTCPRPLARLLSMMVAATGSRSMIGVGCLGDEFIIALADLLNRPEV